jgi:hypothetical protein
VKKINILSCRIAEKCLFVSSERHCVEPLQSLWDTLEADKKEPFKPGSSR